VDVGLRSRVVAVQDLRSEVSRCPEEPATVGQPGVVGQLREAEVDEDGVLPLHQDVRRLDVPVQDIDDMHRDEGLRQPTREGDQVVAGDRPVLLDVIVQREARDIPDDDVRRVPPGIRIVDLCHPGRPHPTKRRDLPGHPGAPLVIAYDVRPEKLDGDAATVRRLRQVDDTHPALADLGEKLVGADFGRPVRLRHGSR